MVIAEISIIPVGTQTPSTSKYVAKAITALKQEKDIKYELTAMGTLVRRQGKWDTFETGVIGHFEACSGSSRAVDYYSREGVSHGATDHRPILAG